ncbi:MAG: M1 family metallopeptidase [Actinomycetes bacterium]
MTVRPAIASVCVAALLVGGGVGVAAAADVFSPGAVGIGDPYVPTEGNGGYQVRAYDLDLKFKPATDRLKGVATIDATATQSLSSFNFDLYGLHVKAVRVDGEGAAFRHRSRELRVIPAAGIPSGSRFQVVVRYSGKPEILNDPDLGQSGWFNTADGAIVVGEPEAGMFWFPVNEHPSDKARMCSQVKVPKGLRAVSTGLPAAKPRTRNGWTTFSWCTRDPMASYLATVAIGKWRVDRSKTASGIPVLNYVDTSLPKKTDRALARTAEMVDYFEGKFGPYPFEAAGGIADNHPSYYALENQTRPTYDRSTARWSGLTATVAHEIAHQWYGDSVALKRWRDIWLNEGFATYAEWMWVAHDGGPSVSKQFNDAYARPAGASFWTLQVSDPGYANLFNGPIYERGAMTLYALRLSVGAQDFSKVMRAWARRHENGNATTADFKRLAERISGQSLGAFFTDWLDDQDKPVDPR